VRSKPRVRGPHSIGPDFGAGAVRPRCLDSIIIHRDIAGYLNGELLDRVRVEGNAFDVFAVIQSVM
jgi:hypothetical protein